MIQLVYAAPSSLHNTWRVALFLMLGLATLAWRVAIGAVYFLGFFYFPGFIPALNVSCMWLLRFGVILPICYSSSRAQGASIAMLMSQCYFRILWSKKKVSLFICVWDCGGLYERFTVTIHSYFTLGRSLKNSPDSWLASHALWDFLAVLVAVV